MRSRPLVQSPASSCGMDWRSGSYDMSPRPQDICIFTGKGDAGFRSAGFQDRKRTQQSYHRWLSKEKLPQRTDTQTTHRLFLIERQIAWMIHMYFRIGGASEATLDLLRLVQQWPLRHAWDGSTDSCDRSDPDETRSGGIWAAHCTVRSDNFERYL